MSFEIDAIRPEILLALAAGAGVAVTIAFRGWLDAGQASLRSRHARVRAARAAKGEARARDLLTDAGFTILGAQVSTAYDVIVDGAPVEIALRADYIASRDGLRWVVEVKTGAQAPRIDTPATRRQLLEYRVAFDVDGVLLADVEAGRVRTIAFPGLACASPPRERARLRPVVWFLVAVIVVVVLANRGVWHDVSSVLERHSR